MKTIQQFNNFRHSTYTPTQSIDDLTKVEDMSNQAAAAESVELSISGARDGMGKYIILRAWTMTI